jgi:bifunctional oligoribonuclease and PAP phosphatase NrnA
MLDWSPFVSFVHHHSRFLLTTHVRPDGDALGSVLALAEALEALGKTVLRVIPSRLPPRYEFLDPGRRVEVFQAADERLTSCDAIVVLDTGTWNQLAGVGDVLRKSTAEVVVIDHHKTQDDLGGRRVVDTSAEANGRLTCQAIDALEVPLTPAMAISLFVALAMDTGWFRHSSVTPYTYELAARLVAAGAKPTPLYEELYEKNTLPGVRLRGRVLDRLAVQAGGQIVWSEVHVADFAETGAIPLDTEDLIGDLRAVAGCEIALMFIEQKAGGVKVSFRARRADVAKLAEQFGGGGHRAAAGATVPGTVAEVRERVLAAAVAAIESFPAGGV